MVKPIKHPEEKIILHKINFASEYLAKNRYLKSFTNNDLCIQSFPNGNKTIDFIKSENEFFNKLHEKFQQLLQKAKIIEVNSLYLMGDENNKWGLDVFISH